MKKLILLITIAASMTLWYSCKKEKFKNFYNQNVQPSETFTSVQSTQEINNHLRWVSIGIAAQENSVSNFKINLHNLLDANDLYASSNSIIQSSFMSFSSHDYEAETFLGVNLYFSSNTYNRSLFYGYNYENCDWTIGVTSPELDDEDFTKQLVVVPAYLNHVNGFDEYIGYYYDTNSGGIDSVLIIDGDNDEDYYKWYVYTKNDCDDGILSRRGGFGECNNDSICQPWLGEKITNCSDCAGRTVPADYNARKDLLLHSVTFNSDWKKDGGSWPGIKYQETYIGGNYEIMFNYLIYDIINDEPKDSFLIDDHFFSGGISHYEISGRNFGKGFKYPFLDILSASGRNPEIKRCKKRKRGGSKCNKGNSPRTFVYDQPMSELFDPITDKIAFNISEFDRLRCNQNGFVTARASVEIKPNRFVHTVTPMKTGRSWTSSSTVPSVSGTTTNQCGPIITQSSMLVVNEQANWVSGPTINGKNAMYLNVINPDDGEMTYTFVIVDK